MILESNAAHPVSYAAYSVQPPRHFTSLGTLVMGSNIYSGPGLGFQDGGKLLMRASITYEDGDTSSVVLRVGANVRTWFNSGPLTCSGPQSLYTARPSDPLSGWIFESATHHFDVQELLLDPARRHKRVAAIRLDGVLLDHACPPLIPHITASSIVFGLSAWPKYEVRDTAYSPVILQQQTADWGGDLYGGYFYNDTLVGSHRTIADLGCFLSCLSMANTFFGMPCTPRSLNQNLQNRPRADGYTWRRVYDITSVAGSSVTFDIVDTTSTIGPTFLIQDARLAPRATIAVTGIDPGGASGSGVVTQQFRGGMVNVGDIGVVYDSPNFDVASEEFSGGFWAIRGFRDSTTAAGVESTLTTNTPALLFTDLDATGAKHWVVADAWAPAFLSTTVAQGTYGIKDPAYLDGNGDPLSRLIQSPHDNLFQDALACSVLAAERRSYDSSVVDGASGSGLHLRLQGRVGLTLQDPAASTIAFGEGLGGLLSDIPGSLVLRRHRIVSPFDPSVRTGTSDDIRIRDARVGRYVATITGQEGVRFALSADALGGLGAGSNDTFAGTISGGGIRLILDYTPTTADFSTVTSVAPPPREMRVLNIDVRPNPTRGVTAIEFQWDGPDAPELAVVDLQGRAIATLHPLPIGTGRVAATWNGRRSGGGRVPPGVYLLRLLGGASAASKRLVLLK